MNFTKIVFPGIAIIAATYGLGRFSYGLFLPSINNDLKMGPTESGIISSLFYLSYCFSIIYSTLKTNKIGPRKMIILGGLFVFIGLILINIAPNSFILSLGVIFAGSSTGIVSPPFGYAISMWIRLHEQGKANTWINSGTSIGLVFAGITSLFTILDWRSTYLLYAVITLFILIWNYNSIPKQEKELNVNTALFTLTEIKYSKKLILASLILGISTATYWTFSKSYVESTGYYSVFSLSIFWILIGLFGIIGGISGSLIDKKGLKFSYNLSVLLMTISSLLLAFTSKLWLLPFISSSLFGASYIFLTGVLLIWGIKIFLKNASIGIGLPFLLLSLGQVIGSLIAGILIDIFEFEITFLIFSFISFLALFTSPTSTKKKKDIQTNYTT
ncbi:MFS transporter [Mammaliicoccus sciuri]|uniref:MFS transporter n=1 Tax=Mammaliicoccus sciuri TaxID=1296 RepID=UPI002DBFFA1F|nr:MFS transporter [Mammaliicoccus sciuri]MEB7051304.1 MFS transporter [Mammaliicoccus sciuri]